MAVTVGALAPLHGPSLGPLGTAVGGVAIGLVALLVGAAALLAARGHGATVERSAWRWLAGAALADGARLALMARVGHPAGGRAAAGLAVFGAAGAVASALAVGALLTGRRDRWRPPAADAAAITLACTAAARAWWLPAGSRWPATAAVVTAGLALATLVGAARLVTCRHATRPAGALLFVLTAGRLVTHLAEAARWAGRPDLAAWTARAARQAGRPDAATLATLLGPALAAAALLGLGALPATRRLAPDEPRRVRGRLPELTLPLVVLASVLVGVTVWPAPAADRRTIGALVLATAALVLGRVVRAVTFGERARAELTQASHRDPLTGLPGRDQVEDGLLAAWAARGRHACRMAVLVIDVDRFQHVNDTRGHRFGDAVLRELAARIVAAAPPDAIVGRTAGDEYTVAVADVGAEEEVLRLADRLLNVFSRPVRIDGEDLFLTATVGIATNLRTPGTGAHDLFREADTALHRAKVYSRGGATVFDAGMRLAVERRVDTEMQLRVAIDRGELTMHYQPVVEIRSGGLVGFEALMRWAHPSGQLVAPNAFIAVAEETGLVVPMGAWALTESLQQLRRWIDDGVCARNVGMAVNLAALQLRDPGLVATVMGALHGTAIPPHQLTLEITETALLSDTNEVERTIERLKSLGVQIALDDFGTGYSSLAHLRRFPIDLIKVDRSFVGNLESSAEDRALVRSIVVMARELGKDVVAEGVETRAQLEVLARIGCGKAQGYLFSGALPAAAVSERAAMLDRDRHRAGDRGAPSAG